MKSFRGFSGSLQPSSTGQRSRCSMSGHSVTSIPQNNILDLFASIPPESLSGVRNLIDVNASTFQRISLASIIVLTV